jgi:hypothetical protein
MGAVASGGLRVLNDNVGASAFTAEVVRSLISRDGP